MPETALNKPYLEVNYQPEILKLCITWKGKVSATNLESGYNEILAFLRKYPVGQILLDLSQRQKLEIAGGTQQLFGEIFKEALKVIKRPLFLAMVLTHEEYFLSTESQLFEKMMQADNDYVITHLFSNRAEAEAWFTAAS